MISPKEGIRALSAMLLAVSALAVCPAQADTLLGSGTLNNPNDLTRVQDGATIHEFLDLSATKGQTLIDSLAMYGGQGFRFANSDEVSGLYSAFGFSYVSPSPDGLVELFPTLAQSTNFVSYLGATVNDAAIGYLNDVHVGQVYSCISSSQCGPDNFVLDRAFIGNPTYLGNYLVRDIAAPVPEPAPLALFSLGLLGFVAVRRAKQ
jgi:hypothetical protein